MLYFALWVFCTVALFVLFRLFKQYNIHTFQAIVINYCVCSTLGVLLSGGVSLSDFSTKPNIWLFVSVGFGLAFISTFYLFAIATQKTGVIATTLAGRMSFFVPMLISLFVLKIAHQAFGLWNYIGVFLASVAIILSIYKPHKHPKNASPSSKYEQVAFPILVFLATGILDSALNFANHKVLQAGDETVFTTLMFSTSATCGIGVLVLRFFIKNERIRLKNIVAGVCLGIPNYFSIYLVLVVLQYYNNNGAVVFPVFNVSVIAVATIFSVIAFKEKLFWVNYVGLSLSVFAIFLVAFV